MNAATIAASASRHAAVRWVGLPLLITGLFGLVSALLALAGGGSGWNLALGAFGTGLALASFGANNDTALALALQASEGRGRGDVSPLSPALAEELAAELTRDRAEVVGLKPAPTVALVLPFVCLAVQSALAWRLLGG